MPYQDFRQFLDVLRQHGELIDVNRPVALNDVGKAMKQTNARQGPAIMFNQNGTDYPLVAGVYSTRGKALLAFEAGNCSRQCQGLQALIRATEWVVSPDLRRSGGIAGSALLSHEPLMNWIDSTGSVRVSIAHNMWSRFVTSTSSSHTTMYFDA